MRRRAPNVDLSPGGGRQDEDFLQHWKEVKMISLKSASWSRSGLGNSCKSSVVLRIASPTT